VGAPPPASVLPARGLPFVLVATGFAAYSFVPSGMSAHLLAILGRAGIDAGTVVAIGALFGPCQVASRLLEFAFGGGAAGARLRDRKGIRCGGARRHGALRYDCARFISRDPRAEALRPRQQTPRPRGDFAIG
jgi:hypothetical protein